MKSGQIFENFCAKNGKQVTLRSLRWEDLDSVLEFADQLIAEREEDPDFGIIFDKKQTRESEAKWLADVLTQIEEGYYINAAAEIDGRIVGNSHVARGRSSDLQNHGVLGISILKQFRDFGIGFEMIRILLDECRRAGLRTIELEVFANNPRAIHLYEKAGFKQVGRIPKKICRRDRFIDAITMAIEL